MRPITTNEPESKNDFEILIIGDVNLTGLTESDITLSVVNSRNQTLTGATLVALDGANSVWVATIRPPDTLGRNVPTGVMRVTVAANAVDQGNAETSKDIRISTRFPDADAETPTLLFRPGFGDQSGITVSSDRIFVNRGYNSTSVDIQSYTLAGVEQPTERVFARVSGGADAIDYFNNTFLIGSNPTRRRTLAPSTELEAYTGFNARSVGIAHTRLGLCTLAGGFSVLPYDETQGIDTMRLTLPTGEGFHRFAHQNDLLYLLNYAGGNYVGLAEIAEDDTINYLRRLNINWRAGHRDRAFADIAVFGDLFYFLNENAVHTLDIKKYRPIAKNTKTTIYPIVAAAGDLIDLKSFHPMPSGSFSMWVSINRPIFRSTPAINWYWVQGHKRVL